MSIVITYDLHSGHREVKAAMLQRGYQDTFIHEGQTVNLPNTTLFHAAKLPKQAVDELQLVCSSKGLNLLRCISTTMDNWWAITGVPLS